MPTHEQITQAVAATGDQELVSWVSKPTSYVTSPVDMSGVREHALHRIMLQADHPMSFFVAIDRSSGRAFVTTSNPEGVARLLRTEPALAESKDLPRTIYELLRDQSSRQQLLNRAEDLPEEAAQARPLVEPATATRDDSGWLVRMTVLDGDGELQAWSLRVPKLGAAVFSSKQLATDLDVDLGP